MYAFVLFNLISKITTCISTKKGMDSDIMEKIILIGKTGKMLTPPPPPPFWLHPLLRPKFLPPPPLWFPEGGGGCTLWCTASRPQAERNKRMSDVKQPTPVTTTDYKPYENVLPTAKTNDHKQ